MTDSSSKAITDANPFGCPRTLPSEAVIQHKPILKCAQTTSLPQYVRYTPTAATNFHCTEPWARLRGWSLAAALPIPSGAWLNSKGSIGRTESLDLPARLRLAPDTGTCVK